MRICVLVLTENDDKEEDTGLGHAKKDDMFEVHVASLASYNGNWYAVRIEIAKIKPKCIVSIGNEQTFHFLRGFSECVSNIYHHIDSVKLSSSGWMRELYMKNVTNVTNVTQNPSHQPLVSVFTTAFNSKDKIYTPFMSLLRQTYFNWEWIIVDDSNEDTETWEILKNLCTLDERIFVFKQPHNGYIGHVKRTAAKLCNGEMLVELDHDDELTDRCIELIVNASRAHPSAGFFYTDAVEKIHGTEDCVSYGDTYAFGYGSHYKYLCERDHNWVTAQSTPPINIHTVSNIVGVPNHARAWRTKDYLALNGHQCLLPVADDYELLLRTILKYKCVHIRHVGYIQYRYGPLENFTYVRNELIQELSKIIASHYEPQLAKELQQLQQSVELHYHRCQETSDFHVNIILSTYNRPVELLSAIQSVLCQIHKSWTLYIIGANCPILDHFMEEHKGLFFGHDVRYWNLSTNANHDSSGYACRNYALRMLKASDWVAYLNDGDTWLPNHLSSIVHASKNDAVYAFSSFVQGENSVSCTEPRLSSIKTSCLMHLVHLVQLHGYWKSQSEVGCSNDWELVSRWSLEKWVATALVSVICE